MAASGPSALLSVLREQVARIEGYGAGPARPVVPFGIPALDGGLPQGGLARGALHEVAGAGANVEHASAAALLVAGIRHAPGGRCSGHRSALTSSRRPWRQWGCPAPGSSTWKPGDRFCWPWRRGCGTPASPAWSGNTRGASA